jgi:hypothetical protein
MPENTSPILTPGVHQEQNFSVRLSALRSIAHDCLYNHLVRSNVSPGDAEKAIMDIAFFTAAHKKGEYEEFEKVVVLIHDLHDAIGGLSKSNRHFFDWFLGERVGGWFDANGSRVEELKTNLGKVCSAVQRPTKRRRKNLKDGELCELVNRAAVSWFEATGKWPPRTKDDSSPDHPLHVFLCENVEPFCRAYWCDWIAEAKRNYDSQERFL